MSEYSPAEKAEKIVEDSRTSLLLTGNLTDFQITNLQKWAYIVFDDIEGITLGYNFQLDEGSENGNPLGLYAGEVTYDFKFKSDVEIPEKKKEDAFMLLNLWVKFLFWNDTVVIFKKEGEIWI